MERIEVDDEVQDRDRLKRQAADSEPADLDQTRERLSGTDQHAAMRGFDMHAVITDEPRERQRAALPGLDQRERETGFSRAGRAADQDRARADENRGGVDRRRRSLRGARRRSNSAALK